MANTQVRNQTRKRVNKAKAAMPRRSRRARGAINRQAPRAQGRTQTNIASSSTVTSASTPARDVPSMSDVAAAQEPERPPAPEPAALSSAPRAVTPATAAEMTSLTTPSAADESPTDTAPAMPRLPRRTRTLADMVRPAREPGMSSGALSAPSYLSHPSRPSNPPSGPLSDPTPSFPRSLAPSSAPAQAPQAEAADEREENRHSAWHESASDPAITSATRPAVRSIPAPRPGRLGFQTRPIPVVRTAEPPSAPIPPRPPRLATAPPAAVADTTNGNRDTKDNNADDNHDDNAIPPRFLRVARLGAPRLAARVALGHAVTGVVVAVLASALVLAAHPLGVWLLALAALAAAGGGMAYLLLWWRRSARVASVALTLAQMGALVWACALVGPRAALLLLAAPAVALALRAGGRWPALLCGIGMAAVYVVFQVAAQAIQPVFGLSAAELAAFDTVCVALGLGLLLGELFAAAAIHTRNEAAARARLYEVRLLRAQMSLLRAEAERDGHALDEAMTRALRGRGVEPAATDGPLHLVAEGINRIGERLLTLQKDREDRLRLEGAIRALARTLERGWLGLPWMWPEPSGTMLDEVVALLRTPRPSDSIPATMPAGRERQHSEPLASGAFPRLDSPRPIESAASASAPALLDIERTSA